MKYTVFRREFQTRYNGFSYFMGDVLVVVGRTNYKWIARAWAFVTKSKWTEGHVEAGMPAANKLPLLPRIRIWLAHRKLINGLKKIK